jgi:hypothetical protein
VFQGADPEPLPLVFLDDSVIAILVCGGTTAPPTLPKNDLRCKEKIGVVPRRT